MATAVAATEAGPGSSSVRAGWGMSGFVILFLAVDGVMKVVQPQIVADTTAQLGWPADPDSLYLLAALLLGSTLLYALPRTAVIGAILITGYLGGAVATHARLGSPLFTHTLCGVYMGIVAWGGLWLRDRRIRALLPLVRSS